VSDAPDHRHCKTCGRVCDPSAMTCSAPCKEAWDRRVQSKRNAQLILYAAAALLLIVLLARLFG